jgi:two-component system sensor histidine kinase RstB
MRLLFLKLTLLLLALFCVAGLSFVTMLDSTNLNDRARVLSGIVDLQIAGLRLAASQLQVMDEAQQATWLSQQSQIWRGPLSVCDIADLPVKDAVVLRSADGSLCQYQDGFVQYIFVPIDETRCLRLGPVAGVYLGQVEEEARATQELLAAQAADPEKSEEEILQLAARCQLPLQIRSPRTLPAGVTERLKHPSKHAVFRERDEFLIASSVPGRDFVLCTGPLTQIRAVSMSYMWELIFVILMLCTAALAIFLVLADRGLRKVEQAARLFAAGDLTIRADESSSEAASLAKAFNFMASRTAASMLAKTELLQLVSHELRTPLARMRFAIELLDTSSTPQEKTQRMAAIHHSVDDLEDIVGEVLEYVGKGGTTALDSQSWLDIPAVLQAFKSSFTDNSGRLQIEWITAGQSFTDRVFADRRAFQHVLRNLIGNAWRFARTTIRISAQRDLRTSSEEFTGRRTGRMTQAAVTVACVCVTVEDDGPGIPDGSHQEVLAPLDRLSDERLHSGVAELQRNPRIHGGYGLGLAIVKRLVERHGGSLQIDRGELGGCRIRTWWPDQATPGQ